MKKTFIVAFFILIFHMSWALEFETKWQPIEDTIPSGWVILEEKDNKYRIGDMNGVEYPGYIGVCAYSPQPAGFIVTEAKQISDLCTGNTQVNYFKIQSTINADIGQTLYACYQTNSMPTGWQEIDTTQSSLCGGGTQHNARKIKNISAQPACDEQTYYHDADGDGFAGNATGSFCPENKPNDYYDTVTDCDDGDPAVNPNATEICDNVDNNCKNGIDENLKRSCQTACGTGEETCSAGLWGNCNAPQPQPEVCDGKDNNCNGDIDEGLPLITYYKDQDDDGLGDPNQTDEKCERNYSTWVKNGSDNCPDVANPYEYANYPYSEKILKGAVGMGNGKWKDMTGNNTHQQYLWQPDNDLDGIGDACDAIVDGDPTKQGYSTSMVWGKKEHIAIPNAFINNSVKGIILNGAKWDKGSPVIVPAQPPFFGNPADGAHRVHFCGLSPQEYCSIDSDNCDPNYVRWGNDGYCTVHSENVNGENIKYGFSHGSDPHFINLGRQMWNPISWNQDAKTARALEFKDTTAELDSAGYRNPIPTQSNISIINPVAYWNWRVDAYAIFECGLSNDPPRICDSLKETGSAPIYYSLSSSFLSNNLNAEYIENNSKNPEYFYNKETYARGTRLSMEPSRMNYGIISNTEFIYDVIKRFKVEWEESEPTMIKAVDYTMSNPSVNHVTVLNNGVLASSNKLLPSSTAQLIKRDNNITYAINYDNTDVVLSVNFGQSHDWHKLGNITNYTDYNIRFSSGTVHDNTIYLAGGELLPSVLYSSNAYIDYKKLYRIIRNTDHFVVEEVATLPTGLINPRLLSVGANLVIISNNNNNTELFKYNNNSNSFENLALSNKPVARSLKNTFIYGDTIYLIGGQDTQGNDVKEISKISLNSSAWTTLNLNLTNVDLRKVVMQANNGNLSMFNIMVDNGVKTTTKADLNLFTEQITVTSMPAPDFIGIIEESEFCLIEESGVVKGGFMLDVCTPFDDPEHGEISLQEKVYTTVGKDATLYAGVWDGIRIFNINDFDAVTEYNQLQLNSTVVDMEVIDSVLYAATDNGVYFIDVSTPENPVVVDFYYNSAYYTTKLTQHNGLLYIGDSNGIQIYNPETTELTNHYIWDEVHLMEVVEDRLYVYYYWYGLVVYDLNNMNVIADNPRYCDSAELAAGSNGDVFIYCGMGSTVEKLTIDESSGSIYFTSLTGDKVELRSTYVYNNAAFLREYDTIRISTMLP